MQNIIQYFAFIIQCILELINQKKNSDMLVSKQPVENNDQVSDLSKYRVNIE
jgi:hypothetical protein